MHSLGEWLLGACPIGQTAEHVSQSVQDSETRRRYGATLATSDNTAPKGHSVRHQSRGAKQTRPIATPTTDHAIAAAVQSNGATPAWWSARELITRGSSHVAKFTPAIAAPITTASTQNLAFDSRLISGLLDV
jgi:hypothetical protein